MIARTGLRGFALGFALALGSPALGQGCTQCRDNAAAAPPETRRAYRHAILLLATSAAGIFVATATLLRRRP